MAWMGGVGIGIVRREGSQVEATLAEGREGTRATVTQRHCYAACTIINKSVAMPSARYDCIEAVKVYVTKIDLMVPHLLPDHPAQSVPKAPYCSALAREHVPRHHQGRRQLSPTP